MDINDNANEPGYTNYNVVQDDQHATAPEKIKFLPGITKDHSTLSTRTSRSSTSSSKSLSRVRPDRGYPRKNMVTMTSFILKKDPFYPIEVTKPHGTKPHYEGL